MIYVIAHRPVRIKGGIPEGYSRLRVGEIFQHQNKDNINSLNPYICELTGLYHLWKHCKDEIIGLVHYSKNFMISSSHLQMGDVDSILTVKDFICAENLILPYKLHEQLKVGHLRDRDTIQKYLEIFYERCPGLKSYFNGWEFNPKNMFVTRKEIMDKYCEWLFNLVLPITHQFIKEDADKVEDIRLIGYIAERLMTYWLRLSGTSYYECPITELKG